MDSGQMQRQWHRGGVQIEPECASIHIKLDSDCISLLEQLTVATFLPLPRGKCDTRK